MSFSSRSKASDATTIGEFMALKTLNNEKLGVAGQLLSQLVRRLRDHSRNKVRGGLVQMIADPTTASTQATGATGVTELRVNLAAFPVVVNGKQAEVAAAADTVLHDTTVYTGADHGTGTSTLTTANHYAYITLVAASNSTTLGSGTISVVVCKGGTASTAAGALAARCTDTEISTRVDAALTGTALPWVLLGHVIVDRSGDTAVSTTYDHTVQPELALNVDTDFFTDYE